MCLARWPVGRTRQERWRGILRGLRSSRRGAFVRPMPGDGADFSPLRLIVLDLDGPDAADTSPSAHRRGRVLVRRDGRPVGVVDVPLEDGLLAPAEEEQIRTTFAGVRTAAPRVDSAELPPITVVIATHDRPSDLRRCLESVLGMDHPDFGVVIVDNAPSSDATSVMMARDFPQVPYVREDVPGLAQAHNRGLDLVSTPLVAFTDDDVVVDPSWASRLASHFAGDPSVGCVTGLIWPAELETQPQALIDAHGRCAKGFSPRRFDLADARPVDPLFPYTAGQMGSGANMAFTVDALEAVGRFDPALGAGSVGRGGDDLAAFFDVVTAGYAVVYEPAAVVHHLYRREYDDLRAQARNYGVGLSAYLTRVASRRPAALLDMVRLAPHGVRHLLQTDKPSDAGTAVSSHELRRLQLLGMALGPFAYARSRWTVRAVVDGAGP